MPILRDLPPEVAAQIDGEGDVDLVIQEQVLAAREGRRRELPEEFVRRVHYALEYSLEHQGLDEHECRHRRCHTDDWLEGLREGNNWERWCERITRRLEPSPEQEAQQKIADERAELLLRSTLSKKQLKELDRRGYFHVVVEARRFRITRGRSHNVKEVDAKGRILRSLCAHPIEFVPTPDTMLTQKLLLESKPEDFFKIANVRRHRGPVRPPAVPAPHHFVTPRVVENIEIARAVQGDPDCLAMAPIDVVEQVVLDATAVALTIDDEVREVNGAVERAEAGVESLQQSLTEIADSVWMPNLSEAATPEPTLTSGGESQQQQSDERAA